MRIVALVLFQILMLAGFTAHTQANKSRLRVMVLTDIENEPDDTQSMIRFLAYANNWDIEGLVATTSTHKKDKPAPEKIRELIRLYGQVRDNLLLHERGFPEESYLMQRVKA